MNSLVDNKYMHCTLGELELYLYMARERLRTAESLEVSIGMTGNVIDLHSSLSKLLDELRKDLMWAEEAMKAKGYDD